MIYTQVFKSADGADKRARFENAHCNGKFHFKAVRFADGQRDHHPFDRLCWDTYTWRIERELRYPDCGRKSA